MNKELEEAMEILTELVKAQNNCIAVTQNSPFTELWKRQNNAIETVLNYIDNSISKEVIEKKIKKLKKCKDITPYGIGKLDVLYELLEGK